MLAEEKSKAGFVRYKIKTDTHIPKPLLLSTCCFFANINIFGQLGMATEHASLTQRSAPLPEQECSSQSTDVTEDFTDILESVWNTGKRLPHPNPGFERRGTEIPKEN